MGKDGWNHEGAKEERYSFKAAPASSLPRAGVDGAGQADVGRHAKLLSGVVWSLGEGLFMAMTGS